MKLKNINTYTIPIQGMTCAACVMHVTNALNINKNIKVLSVNLATETAVINSKKLNVESIDKLLKDFEKNSVNISREDIVKKIEECEQQGIDEFMKEAEGN